LKQRNRERERFLNVAYSYFEYLGDGVTKNFTSPLYINQDHITVYVGSQSVSFTWINSSTVQLVSAPLSGVKVKVTRTTPVNTKLVDFQNGSVLDEVSLDSNTDFLLYAVQESVDKSANSLGKDINGNFDASGNRVVNVGNPLNSNDAVNMSFTQTALTDAVSSHVTNLHTAAGAGLVLDDVYDVSTYLYLAERFDHL